MTVNEFHREFGRLEKHFRIEDDNRKTIISDWFKSLQHYHIDAFSTAIDHVIQDATDTFWPALGRITTAIKARAARYDVLRRQCVTCGGTTWIDAQPMKSNGIVYEYFQRCPDCGIPPPEYSPNRFGSEPLTATEFAEHIGISRPVHHVDGFARFMALRDKLLAKMSMPKAIVQREPGQEG